MDRIAEFMRSLHVPRSIRGINKNFRAFIRNSLRPRQRRQNHQEVEIEPAVSCRVKIVAYSACAFVIVLSLFAFAMGYVLIPAVCSSIGVLIAVTFWFRDNSTMWGRFLDCSGCDCCGCFGDVLPSDEEIKGLIPLQVFANEPRNDEEGSDSETDTADELEDLMEGAEEEELLAQNTSSESSTASSSMSVDL